MSCNLIKEYVEFTKNNFEDYTKRMMGKYFDEEIFKKYIDKYVSIRYYNEEPTVRATLEFNLNHYLNQIYEKDKNVISEFILKLFRLYYYIDNVVDFDYQKDISSFVTTLNTIREEKVGIKAQNFIPELTNILLENNKRKLNYLEMFNTHEFYLEYNQIPKKDIYDVKLKYEIQIPKLYSKFAIKKVWETTMISENKLKIEYYLLNRQILKDILDGIYHKNYLVELKTTLFSKEIDLNKTLEIFNNDIAKDLITIKITYEDFTLNKEKVLSLIKEGYQFGIIIDEKFINSNDDKNIIDLFKYIIIKDKNYLTNNFKERSNLIILE